ncbi:MAG: hypothetical protein Q8M90_06900 [Brevundimonas sp.]|nr:hypothetical protein [Brevundimonas sp.]
MGWLARAIATAILCLSLSGCSTILLVNVSGELQRPVFTPERRAGPICLSTLTIHKAVESQPEGQPVWKIEARNGECIGFARLAYGDAPDGFVELVAAMPLESGVVYSARGRGDIRGPLGAIWVGGGTYIFSGDAWRRYPR